jgi:hypothetical protein
MSEEEVKIVQSTAEIKVGDILECPHGVISLVTGVIDDLRYVCTVMFGNDDELERHKGCPQRIIMPISETTTERLDDG